MRRTLLLGLGLALVACGVDGETLFSDGKTLGTSGAATGATAAGNGAATGQGGASSESGVGGAFTVSSNNVTASSTASSTVTTGGLDPSVCLPKDGDPQCTQCIKGSCCLELEVCAADTTCACMLACTLAKQQNCYSKCKANFNYPSWDAMLQCRTLKCAFQCIGF